MASIVSLIARPRAAVRGMYRGWGIVALAFYTQFFTVGSSGYVFGVLLSSMQRDLLLTQSNLQLPLYFNRFISGALSLVLGPLIDRHGARATMTVSAILAGCALLLVSRSHSWGTYWVAWAMFGVAQPGLGLLGPRVVIANWFIKKRAKAFVIFTLGTSAAGVIAVPIATRIDVSFGWRNVWVILGCALIAAAPLTWWAIRRRPEDLGLRPDGDPPAEAADAAAPTADGASTADDADVQSRWTVRQALRTRTFWCMTGGFLLISLPSSSIFIFMSSFVQSHGWSRGQGALAVSLYALGSLSARAIWGYFLSRVGMHRTMVVFALAYATAIVVFTLQTGLYQLWVTAAILGVGISGSQLLNAQALPDYFGRRIVGSMTGFSTLANVMLGGFGPQIAAITFDRVHSYVPAFLFFASACALAALVFVFASPPVHPDDRAGRRPALAGA
ncbi:MAG: MFS transporter [Dehalococcoidia bacterium]